MRIVRTTLKVAGIVLGALVTASTVVMAAAFSVVAAEVENAGSDEDAGSDDDDDDGPAADCARVNRSHGYVPGLPIN